LTETGDRPVVLAFAGPNGSGKSTITSGVPVVGAYVNADDIKKQLGVSERVKKTLWGRLTPVKNSDASEGSNPQ
jgi:adenylylsulfate kinase-like enzyme